MTTDIAETNNNILELKNITKKFLGGKIIANNNISISFKKNEIHSIVGENGSGKSTLMNIIFGLYKQDDGEIFVNNKKVDMYISGAAKKYKIGMVHQHFHLIDNFTILENIILGQESSSIDKNLINSLFEKQKKLIDEKINLFSKNSNLKKVSKFTKETILNIEKIDKKIFNLINKIKKIEEKKEKNIFFNLKKINNEFFLDQLKLDLENLKNNKKDLLLYKSKYLEPNEIKIIEIENKLCDIKNEIKSQKFIGIFGKINKKNIEIKFDFISKKYKIKLDPNIKVNKLSVGQRQMVEIMKVLWEKKDIIVFDEPTSTLSIVEIEELLKTIKLLKKEGKTIIFISHKLKEIKEISDRVSILRKGLMMGTHLNDESLNVDKIAKEMIGKVINLSYPKREIKNREILKIKKLSYITKKGFKALDNINFNINEGEIFGLAGIEGNGQEQIIEILTGLKKPFSGSIFYKNELIIDSEKQNINSYKKLGIMSHVPIDRMKHGIIPNLSLKFNSMITNYNMPEFSKKWKAIPKNNFEKSLLLEVNNRIKLIEFNLNSINNKGENKKEKILTLKYLGSLIQLNKEEKIILMKSNKKDDIVFIENKNKRIEELTNEIIQIEELNIFKTEFKIKEDLERDLENAILDKQRILKIIFGKSKYIDNSKIDDWTFKIINELRVEGAFNNEIKIRNLSGGNQQKFVVGRELLRSHEIFVAGHPTRGLDVSAIDHIYKKMLVNSENKKATLLYSLEISELVAVCDRMAIMYKGKIIDIIDPKSTSMDEISKMLIGEIN